MITSKSGYTLFPHQEEAVRKLMMQPNVGFFDDMGVGKTVEGVALDLVRRKQKWPTKKTLVVTLSGPVVNSWERHYHEWAPKLSVVTLDPKNREKSWKAFIQQDADVFIMHWDAVRLMPQLQDINWLHIIADEVHKIMHRDSAMSKNLKKIKAPYKTGLSGTPTSGAPHLLWSILNWLYPKEFRSYWKFFEAYVASVDVIVDPNGGRSFKKIVGPKNEVELQGIMAPFTVRRKLRDVRKDMPDMLPPEEIFVEMGPEQKKAYKQMKDDMVAWVANNRTDSDELDPVVAQAAIARLMRLLQFASAYARIDDEGFIKLSEPSTKLDAVMQKIDAALSEGTKLVIFSDFRQLIELLNARLDKADIPYVTIHGKIKSTDRDLAVQEFQNGETLIFTGTLGAGGTGIDLFASSRLIFLNRNWSPLQNQQAIGRVDRIGQTEAVQITDIITSDTIETEKLQTVALKWTWIQKVLGDI